MSDSHESMAARYRRHYARLREQRRCVSCAERLADTETFIRCEKCREVQGGEGCASRYRARLDNFNTQLARVIATADTLTVQEQAADLGVKPRRIYALRNKARRAGHDFRREPGGCPPGVRKPESPRWRELEASQARCRCGLLKDKDHQECDLPTSYQVGSARNGIGRVFP